MCYYFSKIKMCSMHLPLAMSSNCSIVRPNVHGGSVTSILLYRMKSEFIKDCTKNSKNSGTEKVNFLSSVSIYLPIAD